MYGCHREKLLVNHFWEVNGLEKGPVLWPSVALVLLSFWWTVFFSSMWCKLNRGKPPAFCEVPLAVHRLQINFFCAGSKKRLITLDEKILSPHQRIRVECRDSEFFLCPMTERTIFLYFFTKLKKLAIYLHQGLVVQGVDKAIYRINFCSEDGSLCFDDTNQLDGNLYIVWCYSLFEWQGPGPPLPTSWREVTTDYNFFIFFFCCDL